MPLIFKRPKIKYYQNSYKAKPNNPNNNQNNRVCKEIVIKINRLLDNNKYNLLQKRYNKMKIIITMTIILMILVQDSKKK